MLAWRAGSAPPRAPAAPPSPVSALPCWPAGCSTSRSQEPASLARLDEGQRGAGLRAGRYGALARAGAGREPRQAATARTGRRRRAPRRRHAVAVRAAPRPRHRSDAGRDLPGALATSSPGRMLPATALHFALIGVAALLLDRPAAPAGCGRRVAGPPGRRPRHALGARLPLRRAGAVQSARTPRSRCTRHSAFCSLPRHAVARPEQG